MPSRTPRRGLAGWYDLHVHTTHSDGACAPGDVVRSAAAIGLDGLAITDHDTITGLAPARDEADRLGLDLLSGVELSVQDAGGRPRHLLGYAFRTDDRDLADALDNHRKARLDRARAIADRLGGLGYRVDAVQMARLAPRAALGRRHFADWLARTRQIPDRRAAFRGLLEDGGPAFVPLDPLGLVPAIHLLHRAGGVAALAHPGRELRRSELESFAEAGLDAVESEFPGAPRDRRERLAGWAVELGLIAVGGSDFHAPDAPGRWVGAIRCRVEAVHALRQRAAGHTETASRTGRPDPVSGMMTAPSGCS